MRRESGKVYTNAKCREDLGLHCFDKDTFLPLVQFSPQRCRPKREKVQNNQLQHLSITVLVTLVL